MKTESIPSNIKYKAGMSTVSTFIQYGTGSPGYSNWARKTNQRDPNWKRSTLSLFADDIMIYTKDPKESTKKAPRNNRPI